MLAPVWAHEYERALGRNFSVESVPRCNHLLLFFSRVDHLGRLLRCNLNEGTRQCFLGVTADKTQEMYEAYYSFSKRLTDPKNMFLHKLSSGEIVVFDNDRVLHGRTGYTLAEGMGRCLESTYIDWDVARSKLNVLGRKLKKGPVARMDSNLSVVGQWTTA